ncbi:unnamed protein product [Euphydryas editha]|uniref:Uncharacterized protein n=1 Tax=Euphydryas editha TaxID=104508 RepID=A0AAU9UXR3_EUPED|nr:unnamed protein product [Euphydryas editha]
MGACMPCPPSRGLPAYRSPRTPRNERRPNTRLLCGLPDRSDSTDCCDQYHLGTRRRRALVPGIGSNAWDAPAGGGPSPWSTPLLCSRPAAAFSQPLLGAQYGPTLAPFAPCGCSARGPALRNSPPPLPPLW